MHILILLLTLIAFLGLIWWIFYRTFLWTIDPLLKHYQEKDKEQKEMHDALMEIKDKLDK